jgi:hypothetical protein
MTCREHRRRKLKTRRQLERCKIEAAAGIRNEMEKIHEKRIHFSDVW